MFSKMQNSSTLCRNKIFNGEIVFFEKCENCQKKKTNITFSKIAANKCAKKIPQFFTNTSELDPCFVVISLHLWRGKKYEFAKNWKKRNFFVKSKIWMCSIQLTKKVSNPSPKMWYHSLVFLCRWSLLIGVLHWLGRSRRTHQKMVVKFFVTFL